MAFTGIALYISVRYDRRFALLALVALAHDVVIVCGVFAWLGISNGLEVDSLFAVALLTIAGYSVNDTVVVFDRIRERQREDAELPLTVQVDRAVSATLTRTLYTSGTTLLPLLALIFWWVHPVLVCDCSCARRRGRKLVQHCPGSFFVEPVALTFQCCRQCLSPPLPQGLRPSGGFRCCC